MKVLRKVVLLLLFCLLSGSGGGRAAEFLKWDRLQDLPDQHGVASPFAGVSGGALIVAGGANFPAGMPWEGGRKIWHDAVYVLPKPDGQWKSGFKLPRPAAYGISISTPNGLLCIGGGDAERHFTNVFLITWSNESLSFKELPALPRPNAFGSGVLLGTTVYVAGGLEEPNATNTLPVFWALDLSSNPMQWRELEPWPGAPRMLAVAAAQDGSVFVAGGTDLVAGPDGKPQRIYLTDGFRYTPGSGWKTIAKMPRPSVAAPSPAPSIGQSHFLVIGGDDGSKIGFDPPAEHPGFPKSILAYHTITDTWSDAGEAPVAHVTVSAVQWDDHIVIPSGEVRPGMRSREVWSARIVTHRSAFSLWDYGTLGAYLTTMVVIGLYCSRRHQTTADFFLGGKRIPWWAAGVSIFGTQLSAITFLAIPAKVYATDWTYFLNNLMIVAITPLVVFLYLPFFRRLNVTTAYEYLEHRFNVAVRLFAAGSFCILQMGRMGIVLFLPALALSAVTGINIHLCILLMGVLTTIYSATGGIEAVIWTDLAQVVILLLAAVVSLFFIASQVDGGLGTIVSSGVAEGKFHMVNLSWDITTTSILVMTLGTALSQLVPYSADQSVVQRYLTTSDEKQAARSLWTNMAMVIPATLLFFGVGTSLYFFYKIHPERLSPVIETDAVFPWFIANALPPGIIGLVIAGVFAAAMSSLDSSINSMSTVITTDFYRRFRPSTSDKSCLRLAKTLTVLLGIAATGTALLMAGYNIKSLWDAFLRIVGLLGGGMAGLFVLGILSRRANAPGALVGVLVSALLLGWIQYKTRVHFFLFGGIGMVTCVVVGYLASLFMGSAPSLAGKQLTIHQLREAEGRSSSEETVVTK